MENPQGTTLFGGWPRAEAVQRAFRGMDGDLPALILTTPDEITEIAKMDPPDREARWQALRDASSSRRPRRSSLFLRLATPEGLPFEERFLHFFPFNMFPARNSREPIGQASKRQRGTGTRPRVTFSLRRIFGGVPLTLSA